MPAGKSAKGHTLPKGGQLSTLRRTKVPKRVSPKVLREVLRHCKK